MDIKESVLRKNYDLLKKKYDQIISQLCLKGDCNPATPEPETFERLHLIGEDLEALSTLSVQERVLSVTDPINDLQSKIRDFFRQYQR